MKEKFLNGIYIAINVLIIAAVIFVVLFGLWKLKLITPPEMLTKFLQLEDGGKQTVLPGDKGKIYDSLKSRKKVKGIEVYPNITHDNLKAMIENIKPENNYYWETMTTVFSKKESIKSKNIIRFYKGSYRIELYDSKNKLTKLIADNKTSTVVENAEGASQTFPSGTLSLASQAGVAEMSKFLTLPQDASYHFTLVESDFGDLLNLTFDYSYETYTQKEIYWISLDYGLVVRAETYENGELAYLLETEKLSPLPTPSDSLFVG